MYFLLYGHARTSAHAPRPNTGTLPVHRAPFYTKTSCCCCCWCWKGLSLTLPLSLPVHSSGMASEQAKVCWDTKIQIQTWWGMQAGREAFIGWDWMWALEWHRMEWSNNLRQSLVRHAIGFSNDWWGYQRNFPFASTSSAGHWESRSNSYTVVVVDKALSMVNRFLWKFIFNCEIIELTPLLFKLKHINFGLLYAI